MQTIRYPLKPPEQDEAVAYTVGFDYLPHPLHALPLSADEKRDLYTSRFDVSEEGVQISHVFPRTNVRFVRHYGPLDPSPSALANMFLDNQQVSVKGTWFSFAIPTDVREMRKQMGSNVFPTVILYHQVLIDLEVVTSTIVPLLNEVDIPESVEVPDDDIHTKLTLWLRGKMRIEFPNVDNDNDLNLTADTPMPTVPMDDGSGYINVIAIMMDGSGVRADGFNQIQGDLETPGPFSFSDTIIANYRYVVPIPLSYLYFMTPEANLPESHRDHPLKDAWPYTPVAWNGIVFSLSDLSRGSITDLTPSERFSELECKINASPKFPVPRSGLFFYRSVNDVDQLSVFEQSSATPLEISLYSTESALVSLASNISIPETQRVAGVASVLVKQPTGTATATAPTPVGPSIQPLLEETQRIIDMVSANHGISLSTAGAFAKILGEFAKAIAAHLSSNHVRKEFSLDSHITRHVKIPANDSFKYLLAFSYYLLITDSYRTDKEGMAGTRYTMYKIIQELDLETEDLSSLTRPEWMNTHEDGELGTGWKVFFPESTDTGGRKDHFLFSAATRYEWQGWANLGVFYNLVTETHDFFLEDVADDEAYNEKGEEFAEWGTSSDYDPNEVESWVESNLVDNAAQG